MDEPIDLPEYGMRDLFLPGDTPRIALMRLQGMQVDDRSEDAVEWVINNHGLEE